MIGGLVNSGYFQHCLERVLLPTRQPDDVIVADNLASHRREAVRRVVRSVMVRLIFLPTYSPDLKPIDGFFTKLKHGLRKAATRSVDAVCVATAEIRETVTSDECRYDCRGDESG